eukprot:77421-Hanusia_phi.AAC.2
MAVPSQSLTLPRVVGHGSLAWARVQDSGVWLAIRTSAAESSEQYTQHKEIAGITRIVVMIQISWRSTHRKRREIPETSSIHQVV